jgi:hypothetical protein
MPPLPFSVEDINFIMPQPSSEEIQALQVFYKENPDWSVKQRGRLDPSQAMPERFADDQSSDGPEDCPVNPRSNLESSVREGMMHRSEIKRGRCMDKENPRV